MCFSELLLTFAVQKQQNEAMNYKELLESRNGAALAKEPMPYGQLYKKMTGGKYANVVDLRDDLKDSLVFCDALAAECEQNKKLSHKSQLHFDIATDSAGIYGVKVEQGNYQTFARLVEDHPAIVAQSHFIADTVKALLEATAYLHDQGISHVCFSPDNVLARKGDNAPMLLFHGSAYQTINDQDRLYGTGAPYVAPEVLEEGIIDGRADIYSIGKFIEFLYLQSEIPFELKGVIAKATNPDPEKRYQTPEEMLKSIDRRQKTRRSIVSLMAALLVTAIVVGLYFSMTPEREDIEFVKPAQRDSLADGPAEGYDPSTDLAQPLDTTIGHIDPELMKQYEAKAEQIFRKQFTREADRILSNIYSNDKMGKTERNFMASSQSTIEELARIQVKLGNEAGLSDSRSQLIASQIVDQVTNRLRTEMNEKEKKKLEGVGAE